MTTPICDFVRRYEALRPIRLHMPGHKQGTDSSKASSQGLSGTGQVCRRVQVCARAGAVRWPQRPGAHAKHLLWEGH